MSTREIEAEVLKLPVHERARLAQLLLVSLDEDDEVERAWTEEVQRRLEDYEAGRTRAIPAAEVFADVRAQLRK